jgi:3-oxoacyl-[acyl-carrier protein] reductase
MNSIRILEGKIALVTGTSSGIGRSIAEKFAECGAIVYANARKNGSLDNWAFEISTKYNTKVMPLYFDVVDAVLCKENVLKIKNEHGKIDILVNNAGMVTYEMISMVQLEVFKKMWETNVIGSFNLLQLISRIMSRQQEGSIINMASIVGDKGAKGQVSYATTKGAIIAMTKAAAKELANLNIRVNAVAPGMVSTDRFVKVLETSFKDKINQVGMKRLGNPEEIADLCLFLASEKSKYITGQIIGIDGSLEL